MKNHIIFKFIAILLCAASLTGAVGGIAGVVLLFSAGLYDVSVEEMVSAQVSRDSGELADWLAKNYASTELGGAPETLVKNHYGDHRFDSRYVPDHYGYTISDAQGKELMSFHPELREQEDLYVRESFSVTGTYLHVVSLESEQARDQRQEEQREELLGDDIILDVDNTIPAEGAVVESAIFFGADEKPLLEAWDGGGDVALIEYGADYSNNWTIPGEALGFLYYSPKGNLMFHSGFDYRAFAGDFRETEVYEAYFTFRNGQVRLRKQEPVGQLYLNESGHLVFLSQIKEMPEETVPADTEAAVAETEAAKEEKTEKKDKAKKAKKEETVPSSASDVPEETAPGMVLINGKPLEEYQINTQTYYDPEQKDTVNAKFVYLPLPQLNVEVYMRSEALRYGKGYEALALLRQFRNYLLPAAGICLLVFAVFAVYLCTAAGRKPGCEEVRAGGLNRLPLDLYLLAGGVGIAGAAILGKEVVLFLLEQDFLAACGALAALCGVCCLLLVGLCFAFVAQIKTPGGFWWRNTLCGHSIRLFAKFILWLQDWLSEKLLPFCGRVLQKLWKITMWLLVWLYKITEKVLVWLGRRLGSLGRGLWSVLHGFLKLLPVTWQWLLAGVMMILFTMLAFETSNEFMSFCCLLVPVVIILYIAHCYGTLAESTRRMSKGDLNTQVDDALMVGCFKDSAADLNALADVAAVAAQNQLKSERMKTELITNVSHDIKTPLTSIINYVDLLQKPHSEEEGQQYLEVLDRQSQRLKKLIEDLMDMSKANTGNMQVEITTLDAVESITQALGEFSDKLERAGLTPVFRHSQEQLRMRADGRLVWRVLSNLLSNAVKYAMPGTRLYVDVMELEGTVVISLKNISREELRVTSEELMARFVRGDESRNTEGSGLGLNIARSLMELQKGQLQLLVDGDLFKVTLVFPGTDE